MLPDVRVPGYLGRVLSPSGAPAGTCFQVSPAVLVTAWHVLRDLGCDEPGAICQGDALNGAGAVTSAQVLRTDPLHDLAVLQAEAPLAMSAPGWFATDWMELRANVVITGVSEVDDPGRAYRYLDAPGEWAGGTTRNGQLCLGRLSSPSVLPGMSGAPVRLLTDDRVAGVVSARYNSTDGWLEHSVWVVRTENVQALLTGIAEVRLDRPSVRQALLELRIPGQAPTIMRLREDNEVVFGRFPKEGVTVEHPAVSRSHAAFVLSRRGLTIRDLHSKNRTYVGGKPVFAASLSSGDAVTLGRTGPEIVVLVAPPRLASTQTEFGS